MGTLRRGLRDRWPRTWPPSLLTVLMLLAWHFGTVPATAAPLVPQRAAGVSITADTAEVTFPDQVQFRLVASSANTAIERVTLLYSLDGSPVINEATPDFTPGKTVDAVYAWRVREALVPGTEISYHWALETTTGARWTTEPRQVSYNDTRFVWQQATAGLVTVFWYGPDDATGQELLSYIRDTLEVLEREYALTLEQTVKVFVYASEQEYASALTPFQVLGAGMTVGVNRIFMVLVQPPEANEQTVRHEITHALFLQRTDNPFNAPPRWLTEGFSMFLSGEEMASANLEALRQLASQERLFSLKSLNGNFPSTEQELVIAYVESYSAVRYIIEQHGTERVRALLQAIKDGSTTDGAFQQALGVTVDELDQRWQDALKQGKQAKPSAAPRARHTTAGPPPEVADQRGVLERTFAFWRGIFGSYARAIVIGVAVAGVVAVIAAIGASIFPRKRSDQP